MRLTSEQLEALSEHETPEGGIRLVPNENWKKIQDAIAYYEAFFGEQFRLPNLQNATTGFIVDELGYTRKAQSRAKKMEGIFKQVLSARRIKEDGSKEVELQGDTFKALFADDQTRVSLNAELVKQKILALGGTEDDFNGCYVKSAPFTVIRTPGAETE